MRDEKGDLSGRLPGEGTRADMVERMIRVDHAGEYGAVRIYEGQMAVLGAKAKSAADLRHMKAQEDVHLATFDDLVRRRRVRPTALMPFWHLAGYALGAGTALLGEKAAHACTVAIEETIDAHYAGQIRRLAAEGGEPELERTFEKFRAEEVEHRDTALANGAEEAPGYDGLKAVIKAGSKLAIWLSTRI